MTNIKLSLYIFFSTFLFSPQVFSQKTWTFLIYLNGDNDLWEFALQDFNELEVVGSTSDVNVVVQIDLPRRLMGTPPFNDTRRYYVEKDPAGLNETIVSTKVWPESGTIELDMGDPATATDFISWGVENYPADHYLIILWDHGDGWKRIDYNDRLKPLKYISSDMTSGSSIEVSNGEFESILNSAVAVTGKKIDLFAMDACLMGMWEVDLLISSYADFIVQSEETENSEGYNYTELLSFMELNPSASPREVCAEIVRDSIQSVGATLSCIDTGYLPSLSNAIDTMATEIINSLPDSEILIISRTDNSIRFGDGYYADLYSIANAISQESGLPPDLIAAVTDVKNSTLNAVVLSEARGWSNGAKGISIYYPVASDPYSYDPLYSEGTGAKWADYHWDEMLCSFSVIVCSPDEYEPDDNIIQAKEIKPQNPVQNRSIFPLNDTDYIYAHVWKGVDLTFYTSGTLDTYMWLIGENGAIIKEHDDISSSNKNARIQWVSSYNGIVYIKIQQWGTQAGWFAETGKYQLNMSWQGCDLLDVPQCLQNGICSGTQPECVDNEWFCPYPEIFSNMDDSCDGLDNDCDGEIDEEFTPYSCGTGECENKGECIAGVFICNPLPPPADEDTICNGRDDDCDGLIDEDAFCPQCDIENRPECLYLGVCKGTKPECTTDGRWVCNYPSTYNQKADPVDGLDNNCNGLIDEDAKISPEGAGLSCSILILL